MRFLNRFRGDLGRVIRGDDAGSGSVGWLLQCDDHFTELFVLDGNGEVKQTEGFPVEGLKFGLEACGIYSFQEGHICIAILHHLE